MTTPRIYPFLVFALLTVISCPPGNVSHALGAEQKQPIQIVVSILPQEYFVKRIGGDRVQVKTLVQPGHSPATYAPTPKQMAGIATSKLYFRIGVPFENALIPKLNRSVPHLTIIDQRQNIVMLPMQQLHDDDNDHHGDLDPHTWLDPMLALKQSLVIHDSLVQIDPAGADQYQANFISLTRDLEQLDRELKDILRPYKGNTIYVFHPAYGYFCRAYGLKQKAINPDGKEPGAEYLARLIEKAGKDNVRVIFAQPQFSDKTAQTIAQSIGGSVVALDPLAEDYLANMNSMARQLSASMPKPKK